MFKHLFGWKKKIDNGQRLGMESILDSTLHPIVPRPQFVDNLRRGLMDYEMFDEGGSSGLNYQNTILIFAGFFSAALLLSIGIRILLSLLGMLGIVHYHRRRMQLNRLGSAIKSTT